MSEKFKLTKRVNTVLICKMVKTNPATGEETYTISHFRSKTYSIINNTENEYSVIVEEMLENLAKFQKQGSGWRLHSIEGLEIFITKFKPLKGNCFKPFLKYILNKKAVINMENEDNQCFKWAVTRALHPVGRNAGRIYKNLKTQAEKYNWSKIEFPKRLKIFKYLNLITILTSMYFHTTRKKFTR